VKDYLAAIDPAFGAASSVASKRWTDTGQIMARLHLHPDTLAPAFLPGAPHRYLVVRQDSIWLIKFDGEEYGPYESEREAIVFAIDAANKLGGQGEQTEVLQIDESGEARRVWSYGHDPYPPPPNDQC
jgi:hypothetical protein